MSDLPTEHVYLRLPKERAEAIELTLEERDTATSSAWDLANVTAFKEALEEAERIEADRKELEQYSKPLVPLDVPPEVWGAVESLYDAQWTPAPNHHPEYRDVRAAFRATIAWLKAIEQSYGHPINLDMVVPPTDPQG